MYSDVRPLVRLNPCDFSTACINEKAPALIVLGTSLAVRMIYGMSHHSWSRSSRGTRSPTLRSKVLGIFWDRQIVWSFI